MIAPWPLPDGWRWMRLAESARVASDLVDPSEYPDLPHIAPNHIESQTGKLLPYTSIRNDGVTSPKHLFRPGNVLYSKIRPYLAKVVVVDFEGLCSADMYPIESDVVDARYLKWWMLHPEFTRLAAGQQARTVLPKINRRALDQLPVPVPPKDEQRRIVDILEDHLSHLDSARGSAERARARLGLVVHATLVGSSEVATAPRIPLVAILRSPLANGRSVKTLEGGFPVLRLTALGGRSVRLAERKPGAWSAAQARPFLVERADFLVARGNGSLELVGRGATVVEEPDAVAFPDTMIRIRTRPSEVDPEYFAAIWNSRVVRAQVERMARTTAGIYKVNQSQLSRVELPLPDLEAQRRIAQRLLGAADVEARSRTAIDVALGREAQLRRALLAAAFSGRLTGRSSDLDLAEEMAAT